MTLTYTFRHCAVSMPQPRLEPRASGNRDRTTRWAVSPVSEPLHEHSDPVCRLEGRVQELDRRASIDGHHDESTSRLGQRDPAGERRVGQGRAVDSGEVGFEGARFGIAHAQQLACASARRLVSPLRADTRRRLIRRRDRTGHRRLDGKPRVLGTDRDAKRLQVGSGHGLERPRGRSGCRRFTNPLNCQVAGPRPLQERSGC